MNAKRIKSNWYTKGKFGRGYRETLDRDNEFKIKVETDEYGFKRTINY